MVEIQTAGISAIVRTRGETDSPWGGIFVAKNELVTAIADCGRECVNDLQRTRAEIAGADVPYLSGHGLAYLVASERVGKLLANVVV